MRLEENNELDSDVMDPEQFKRLSETDFIPNRVSENFIELGGWKLNVRRTIFESGSVDDVIQGWRKLSHVLPMGLLSVVFFFRSAYENLKLGLTYEKGYETDLLRSIKIVSLVLQMFGGGEN